MDIDDWFSQAQRDVDELDHIFYNPAVELDQHAAAKNQTKHTKEDAAKAPIIAIESSSDERTPLLLFHEC